MNLLTKCIIYYVLFLNYKTAYAATYRLPDTIIPTHYSIRLQLETSALSTSNLFSGTTKIHFNVKPNQSVTQIKFHAKDLVLIHVELKSDQNNEIVDILAGPYESDPYTDIVTVHCTNEIFARPNSSNGYTLFISYYGAIKTKDLNGFYRSTYKENGTLTKYLATTQFESTSARKAFPCLDEPQWKATFALTVTYPKPYKVLSNTLQDGFVLDEGTRETVTFKETPKMSTYLVAFVISEFTCDYIANSTITLAVCSRNEMAHMRGFAKNFVPKILQQLDNFTNIPYVNSINTLTSIAIPDISAGAMENWGLVTFKESALLWDELESSDQQRQRIVTIIAHEFAHMWFGNLVTMRWWSDIFLNEGFARYLEYHIPHKILPEWELDRQFVIEIVQLALEVDQVPHSVALSSTVSNPDQISNKFTGIAYNKGASILRMISHFMTADSFQRGLQHYLRTYQFKNTVPQNLWDSLGLMVGNVSDHNLTFPTTLYNWTYSAGYPLLTVTLNGTNVTISQERFMAGKLNNTKWHVPISYTLSTDQHKFNDTSPRIWLHPETDLVVLPNLVPSKNGWIILNNQQTGFYRVNYDRHLWARIEDALKDFSQIHAINRAQLIDDAINLAKINRTDYARVYRLLNYLQNDTDYYPWHAAHRVFTHLLMKTGNKQVQSYLGDYIRYLLPKFYNATMVFNRTTIGGNPLHAAKQKLAFTLACSFNYGDCLETSVKLFAQYKDKLIKPDSNLRTIVYCTALRHYSRQDDIENNWNFLWNAYKTCKLPDEKVLLLNTLGCTSNRKILNEYLNKVRISDADYIKPEDILTPYIAVYTGSSVGVDVVIDLLTYKFSDVLAHLGTNNVIKLINGLADSLTKQHQIDQFKYLLEKVIPFNTVIYTNAKTALQNVETEKEWIGDFEKQTIKYFFSASSINHINIFVMAAVILVYYL